MRDQEKVAQPPQLAQTGAKREPDRAKHQDSVVQKFLGHTTPSAPSKEASQLLLDVAATPPLLRSIPNWPAGQINNSKELFIGP
jgi:hypothetical protein